MDTAAVNQMNQQLRSMSEGVTELVQFLRDSNSSGARSGGSGASGADGNRRQIESAAKAQSKLLNSSNALAASFASNIKLTGETNKLLSNSVQENIDAYREIQSRLDTNANNEAALLAELESRTGIVMDNFRATVDEVAEAQREVADAQQEVTKSSGDLSSAMKQMKDNWLNAARVGSVVAGAGGEMIDVMRAHATYGADITAKEFATSKLLGVQQAELMKFNSGYMQTLNATGQTTAAFSDKMLSAALSTIEFTGSTQNSMKLLAENTKLAKMSGADTAEATETFVQGMNQAQARAVRQFGMTSETFIELNAAMYQNSSMQKLMFKQTKAERRQGMLDIANRRNELMNMGLFAEQADKAITTLAELTGGGSEKDRMHEAANLAATMGAMGMGAEGQRAFEIMNMGPKEAAKHADELQTILLKANKLAAENSRSSNQAVRLQQDLLNARTGQIGEDSASADIIRQSELAAENEAKLQKERDEASVKVLHDATKYVLRGADIARGLVDSKVFSGAFGGVLAGFSAAGFAKGSLKLLQKGWSKAAERIRADRVNFGSQMDRFKNGAKMLADAGKKAGSSLLSGAKSAASAIASNAGRIASAASSGAARAPGLLASAGAALASLGSKLKPLLVPLARVGLFFARFLNPVTMGISVFASAYTLGKKLFDWLYGVFPALEQKIANFLEPVFDAIHGIGGFVKEWLIDKPLAGFKGLYDGFIEMIDKIKAYILGPIEKAKDIAEDTKEGFKQYGKDIADGSFFSNVWGTAKMVAGIDDGFDTPEPVVVDTSALDERRAKQEAESNKKKEADNEKLIMLTEKLADIMSTEYKANTTNVVNALKEQIEELKEGKKDTVDAIKKSGNGMPYR